ncbi:MAG: hypothetical protein HYT79_02725 [Elusimicrobia bacterium]|nr:hypothetical protein [Elusimicrobiota bacterium]
MKVEGADVRVDTIESGAVIHITSKNPNVVKKIQDAALQMADGTTKKAAYACPMGDYSGVQTKDSRCPKCGMNLEKR